MTAYGEFSMAIDTQGLSVPRRIGALGEGVDLLGDDGYAIAPPSQVPCLRADEHEGPCHSEYRWSARRMKLAPLPDWIIQASRQRDPIQREPDATPAVVRQAMKSSDAASTAKPPSTGKRHACPARHEARAITHWAARHTA
ncbi:MAG: bifunctional DNA primase/polymerase [Egibacteraceae bacterium]